MKNAVSPFGLGLIRHAEGCKLTVYLDSQGHPTIGIGHRIPDDYPAGLKWTTEQALRQLELDSQVAAGAINTLVKVPLSQPQFDALVCFVFNIGVGHFRESTLLKLLNKSDYVGAGEEILVWIKNPELKGRRQMEHAIWVYGTKPPSGG